jgi:hypothetical protein
MLQKDFAPYEPSLALKELGFDEPCFGEYRQWDGNEPWLQLYQDLDGCSTDPADYEYTQEALAPTFSQAFRWFRKKYKIHSVINLTIIGTWYFELYDLNDKRNAEIKTNQNEFKTPEEAELACLIKLIEIVKNKQ